MADIPKAVLMFLDLPDEGAEIWSKPPHEARRVADWIYNKIIAVGVDFGHRFNDIATKHAEIRHQLPELDILENFDVPLEIDDLKRKREMVAQLSTMIHKTQDIADRLRKNFDELQRYFDSRQGWAECGKAVPRRWGYYSGNVE